jgi:hypothetical protein
MKTVDIRYGVTFGKGDSSDWIDWTVDLTDEEEKIYDHAIENKLPLNEIPELEEALRRAYVDIEEEEISMGIDNEDEYTMECQGMVEVDPDEINDLIADRDPRALAFFGLEDADDDELDEWDANDLDELPLIKDFVEGFEPYSPYDEGWILNVEFVDPNNDW